MNEHTIVNGIFAVIAIVVFAVRVFRKFSGTPAAPPAPVTRPGPVVPNVTAPAPGIDQIRRRLVRQIAETVAASQPAPARIAAPIVPPVLPPVVRAIPRAPERPAAPAFPVEAAAAFPVLDLTLPDADAPAGPAPVRRRGRSMRGTGIPGSTGWGAGAIVAMEILGPPVSLRAGATLGAPHAF